MIVIVTGTVADIGGTFVSFAVAVAAYVLKPASAPSLVGASKSRFTHTGLPGHGKTVRFA